MSTKTSKKPATKAKPKGKTPAKPSVVDRVLAPYRWAVKWGLRVALGTAVFAVALVALFSVINPPTTPYMWQEGRRLPGGVDHQWVPIEAVSPFMQRAAVAAEDANFCNHWGFDVAAIQAAIEGGGARGASTISQQVVKNVFLWQGRSWIRKAFEAALTPVLEATLSKQRILEVYLNIAEMDEGVFGVEAASRHYFGVGPEALSATQAARIAAILPSPKTRSASRPSAFVKRRAASIRSGAATIAADGRSACFEG